MPGGRRGAQSAVRGGHRGASLLAAAENSTATDDDIAAHAEINAIRAVCRGVGQAHLVGAAIYTSGEPCPMCMGAIIRFGLRRVVFGQSWSEVGPTLGPQAQGVHVAAGAITALAPHAIEVVGPCDLALPGPGS